jgi:hypothetical protein
MTRALDELVSSCSHLPWPGPRTESVVVWPAPAPPASGDPAPARAALAAFLRELAGRLAPALVEALGRAARAWDQIDAVNVLDAGVRARADAVAAGWRAVGGAEATLALLTLDAAVDLVRLVERRLATLVRLRLRSRDPALVTGGRPFLDVAGALVETARRWA